MQVYVENVKGLQQAIYRLAKIGGGEILVAPGRHAVARGVKLKSNVTVRGFGQSATWFYPADEEGFDEPFFSVDEGDVPYTENITLRDFSIDGMFTPDRQAYPEKICRDFKKLEELGAKHWRMGVYLTDEFSGSWFRNITVENVDIFRCANGMHILSSEGVFVRNGRFDGNGCVIQHHHNLYFRRCKNVVVSNVELTGSPHGVGLNLGNGCTGFRMENSVSSGNGYRGVRFDGLESLSTDIELENNIIHANCLKYPDEPALRLHTIKDFRIIGNTFLSNNTEVDFLARLVRKGEIRNNRFLNRRSGSGAFVVEKEKNVKIEDNEFIELASTQG